MQPPRRGSSLTLPGTVSHVLPASPAISGAHAPWVPSFPFLDLGLRSKGCSDGCYPRASLPLCPPVAPLEPGKQDPCSGPCLRDFLPCGLPSSKRPKAPLLPPGVGWSQWRLRERCPILPLLPVCLPSAPPPMPSAPPPVPSAPPGPQERQDSSLGRHPGVLWPSPSSRKATWREGHLHWLVRYFSECCCARMAHQNRLVC